MKQTRKSKTNRKKTTRTKSTRTKSRTRRNKRMMKGGNPQITPGITSYDKIYEYLLELLNRPDFKQIYEKNKEFIKSISINNDNFSVSFDFSTNEQFRNFINDLLQWLLFDYNPYIFDTLLTIIYSCFDEPEFLKDNVDSLQILFKKLQDMIVYKSVGAGDDVEKINEINLLTFILYVLTIPSISLAVSDLINKNKVVFQNNLKDIKCVITEITYEKIKNTPSVRNAITNYFDSFNPKIRYTEIPGLVGNIAKCLPNLLNTFAANFVKAKANAVSQSFGKNIVSPAKSLYSRIPKFQIPNILPK
uniref:Uncharacterized protein n=1 Tax=viral metagenome TaxID=1070528 RepID=A0A6C0HAC0_9ZZZZ